MKSIEETKTRKSGIDIIGNVSWGTHFCQFYKTKQDLIDILVPYFKVGLENNEFCMWVTSQPLSVKEAMGVLKKKVKGFDKVTKKGQIEILDYSQWYIRGGRFDADKVLAGWVEKEHYALRKGFSGLRLSGNTFWLEKKDWKSFRDYEEKVNGIIGKHEMLAICTYSLSKCSASEIIDVIANHQFALIKREKKWEVIQSAEYKSLKESLEESEQRLYLATRASKDAIWDWDLERGRVWWNEAYTLSFGRPKNTRDSRQWWIDHIHFDDRQRVVDSIQAAIKGKNEHWRCEYRFQKKDGSYGNIFDRAYIARNKEGKAYRMVGAMLDLTERKKMEEELKKAKDNLELQVAQRAGELQRANEALKITKDNLSRAQAVAHIGSWYLDVINDILIWSDETYRIFGLDIGAALTYEMFLEIVHPDDREYVDKCWKAALNKEPYDIEHRIVVGGKVKWVREKAQVEFNKEGKAIRGIGTVQDITERKQREEDSRRLQEELMHVSRVATMGELTAALAHELNQPLMAIMSNAQAAQRFLAKEIPDVKEVQEILSDIIKDDNRASGVITRLRALLKKSEFEFAILDINDVIREVIPLVQSDTVIRNISLSIELNDNIPFVRGDRIQLQQVILNLILNSFEAMAGVDSKRLCISTEQKNNQFVTVSVMDSGIGVDDKNIDSLFKPFFTTKKEGLGMGLAINKAIVEAHGGSLWARNNPDQGATFYFTLPIE